MVRINLIEPKKLSDQHLIAEYDEMLMLVACIKKYPSIDDIPSNFTLNKGHMKFFKDKVLYLSKRHELLKKEMKKRGFKTNKTIEISEFNKENLNDWKPNKKDQKMILERISEKLQLKPEYYRYYRECKPAGFFIELLKKN
jgi:deoxyribonuclease (pyrimidine dimer)